MDNKSLNFFLQLADTLHFGRASERCHVSPSTLSRAIAQLEEGLGVSLFERDNRSVSLTVEGELFSRYARESLQHWESFQNSLMEEAHELHGEISLYCSVTASYSFLYDLLADFRARHPKISIKLHTGDPERAVARVLAGDEHISMGALAGKLPSTITFKPIAQSPLVFIAPRGEPAIDALLKSPMRAERWARVPMIVPERGVARERLDNWFRDKGIAPHLSAQVAGNEAIVSMVSLGGGVGVVPRIVLQNSPLAKKVRELAVSPALEPFEVGLFALRKRMSNPLIRAFWSAVR